MSTIKVSRRELKECVKRVIYRTIEENRQRQSSKTLNEDMWDDMLADAERDTRAQKAAQKDIAATVEPEEEEPTYDQPEVDEPEEGGEEGGQVDGPFFDNMTGRVKAIDMLNRKYFEPEDPDSVESIDAAIQKAMQVQAQFPKGSQKARAIGNVIAQLKSQRADAKEYGPMPKQWGEDGSHEDFFRSMADARRRNGGDAAMNNAGDGSSSSESNFGMSS